MVKIGQNSVSHLSIKYRFFSPNFDKGVFRFSDVQADVKL